LNPKDKNTGPANLGEEAKERGLTLIRFCIKIDGEEFKKIPDFVKPKLF